jgi:putative transposase
MTTTTYRGTWHSVSLLHAHLVLPSTGAWCSPTPCSPSPRPPWRSVCVELGVDLVEFTGETDHVHLLVVYPPTPAISVLAQRLKDRTAHSVPCEYTGACVRARMRGHVSSPSHFAVSRAGAPQSIINQYIDGQARPLRTPGCARPHMRWAHPELKSEACAQELGHDVSVTLQAKFVKLWWCAPTTTPPDSGYWPRQRRC